MDPSMTQFQIWQALLRDDEHADIVKTAWGHHAIVDDGEYFSIVMFDNQGRMIQNNTHKIPENENE